MIDPATPSRLVWNPATEDFRSGSGPTRRQGRLLLVDSGPGLRLDGFHTAVALLDGDPRVVSVSGSSLRASSSDAPGAEHIGSAPGIPRAWILLDLSSADLIDDPRLADGSISASSLALWAANALSRGFRHVRLSERALRPVFVPGPMWPERESPDLGDPLSAESLHENQFRAGGMLSIAVDARWLGPHETGAQVATTRLIEALADRSDVASIHLFGLPEDRLPNYAARLGTRSKVHLTGAAADIFWRPSQPDDGTLMSLDRASGGRVVVTVLDLIEYANPSYSANPVLWAIRRERLRRYLRQADMVTGISQDVLNHIALEVPGIEAQRLVLTPLGIDQPSEAPPDARPPDALVGLRRPYLLVLGSDYRHKNRDFAIRVWQQVAKSHDVDLVLAGLNLGVERSTTHREEAQFSRPDSESARRVHRIPHVDAEEKAWLLQHAAVLLYPTSAEGFGFLPHEAAAVGVPAVFTAFGPLAEHFAGVPGPTTWNVEQYATEVAVLLSDSTERARMVMLQSEAGRGLTWESSAEHLMDAFRQALNLPPQPYGLWEQAAEGPRDPSERLPVSDASFLARQLTQASLTDRAKQRVHAIIQRAPKASRRRTGGQHRR